MHNLEPITALGGADPRIDTIGTITITENPGVALASVAARSGKEAACRKILKSIIGAVPGPGRAQLHDPEAGFWIGPDQWIVGAPMETHETLADHLAEKFGNSASVTEQSGAWVCFDVRGTQMPNMMELLCPVPIRQMAAGDAHRTQIHQLGCFVIRRENTDHVRILGPRSSAKSLYHALTTAAHSVA